MASNYYNDLLKEDLERERRIERNEITREEANDEEKEWADVRSCFAILGFRAWCDDFHSVEPMFRLCC